MPAIWGFIGPEGAGKTTAMTYWMELHMLTKNDYGMTGQCRTFPGYELYTPHGQKVKEITTKDMVSQMSQLQNIIVGIDEIQQFNDSSRHMTVINQLTGYVGMQRRKVGLGIFYTLQNWQWLYDRMRWLTHLLTVCSDLHFTPWGRENHIPQGMFIQMKTYDCKGFLTGEPWAELAPMRLQPSILFPYYRSYNVIDIFEGQEQIKVKKRVTVFDVNQPGNPTIDQLAEAAKVPAGMQTPQMTNADLGGLAQALYDRGMAPGEVDRLLRNRSQE
ncbi:hypothetical protein [Dehalogenimonas alkenigignens]|uniref:hypothetical protein n=1 Tax=Dehalogenimonas alkenigignens TaxID=1217799 RepID=UPI000D580489|nr:hypothetical protein [Dehalogenimonas alkenigignens]PVV83512.1 hypothetical protein DD509_06695 [Dehalogenimonas alkenigignens]